MPDNAPQQDRRAFIDIGSNTVRLAIFPGPAPDHRRLVNERVRCRLADDLDRTGRLSPAGIVMATDAIADYFSVTSAHDVSSVRIVATAAVREASDGKSFAGMLERRFGHPVRILRGDEEAFLSARGVMSGFAGESPVDGLIVDLGGGSLELVDAKDNRLGRTTSLPLGHIRLIRKSGGSRAVLDRLIEQELVTIAWLGAVGGKRIYLAGGAFRKLACCHMQTEASQDVPDGYAIDDAEFRRYAEELPRDASGASNLGSVDIAAGLVRHLLAHTRAERVVFSARGLLDGCHAEMSAAGRTAA